MDCACAAAPCSVGGGSLVLLVACSAPTRTAAFARTHLTTIDGRVIGTRGQPLSDVKVAAYVHDTRGNSYTLPNLTTDASGEFSLTPARVALRAAPTEPDSATVTVIGTLPVTDTTWVRDSVRVVAHFAPSGEPTPVQQVTLTLAVP